MLEFHLNDELDPSSRNSQFIDRSVDWITSNLGVGEGVEVNYLHQNYLETKLDDPFDLILMIFCDFCALSPSQRRLLLHQFHRILDPDGRLLFDVYSKIAYEQRDEAASYVRNQPP